MTLAHDVTGSGPPVLLLHSMVCDRRMWDPQVPVLVAAGLQVIRCDIAGFGESPLPAGPYNDASDVASLLGPSPTAIVAASGSGNVALELAARWPSRVSSLALICSALSGWPASPARQAFAEQEDALLAAGDLDAATELNVRTWVGPAAGEAARDAVRVQQRHIFEIQTAVTDEPPAIEVEWEVGFDGPALIVSGDLDLPDFTEIAASLAGRLPQARWERLDWAGHLPSLEDPARFNPLLVDFLTAG